MEFFRLIRLLAWEESDKSGIMAIHFTGECDFVRAKITERLVSSPDEFPKQRNPAGDFSGLIDLWEKRLNELIPRYNRQNCLGHLYSLITAASILWCRRGGS